MFVVYDLGSLCRLFHHTYLDETFLQFLVLYKILSQK